MNFSDSEAVAGIFLNKGYSIVNDEHDADMIFLVTCSVREMAEALCRIEDDDALRADLVARGLERVKAFTWERCAGETLATYRDLVGSY